MTRRFPRLSSLIGLGFKEDKMKKIRIAQIGTSLNSHGNNIFEALKKNSDVFEVVGYALPEGEREKFPERMPAFEGYREMTVDEIMNDCTIDAVAVETEEIYTTKYAIMAAEHGKHIHMEKPGGTSLEDFEHLISLMKQSGKTFHTGYMYRYNPVISDAIRRARSGELGKIHSVEVHMDCIHPVSVREWLSSFKGGMMFFLGCHLVDIIFSIQGEPNEVIPLNTCSGWDVDGAEDIGMAVFKYDGGVSFAKTSAVEQGGFTRRQLVICGEKETIEIRPLEYYTGGYTYMTSTVRTVTAKDAETGGWNTLGVTKESEPFKRYDAMMLGFASIVRGERENPWPYDYELELYKLVLRACGAI